MSFSCSHGGKLGSDKASVKLVDSLGTSSDFGSTVSPSQAALAYPSQASGDAHGDGRSVETTGPGRCLTTTLEASALLSVCVGVPMAAGGEFTTVDAFLAHTLWVVLADSW